MTDFIDLTETRDGLAPYEGHLRKARRRSFPIRDASIPYSPDQTLQILDTIDAIIGEGGMVYVHCWGGIGRTGVVVGCWLARQGQPGKAALDELKQLWQSCPKSADKRSPETDAQDEYILRFPGDKR